MSEESESKFNIPWDTERPCRVQGDRAPTRLETNYNEEFDGALFDGMCPNLDPNIPKLKDNFIDFCPIDLPDIPKVLLKLKKFDTVPFAGVPTSEIPKALLSHLLPCCLKGRTTGFDIDLEQDLDKNGEPVTIDPDEALLPISIQFGERGILKLGIDVFTESCFCDESCGPEDFLKIKFRYGVKYLPEEDVTPEDVVSSIRIEEEDVNQLFVSNRMVGMLGQIVSCEPEATVSQEARDMYSVRGETEYRGCTVEEGICVRKRIDESEPNRWKYKVRLLNYNPCNVTASSILGENGRAQSDLQPSLVFPAYNLNEWSASGTTLPTGFSGKAAWHATYDSIINNTKSKAKTKSLPCPVGAIVYLIDPSAMDCCNDCDDGCEPPPLLFYHQNRDVPETPIMFLGSILDNSSVNVHSTVTVTPTTESNVKIAAKIAPQYYDEFAAEPLNTGVFCFMDTNGDYWAIPSQKNEKDKEMFAIYDGDGYFTPVDDDGALVSHDDRKNFKGKKAPYIPKLAVGGLYLMKNINNNWIALGGTCPPDEEDEEEEVGEVPTYTTVPITMQLPDGDPTKATPESGDIFIGPHPLHAELGACIQIKIEPLEGLEGREVDLFYQEPEFELNTEHDTIHYSNIILNPSKAGLAVYSLQVKNCNTNDADYYRVVFRCMEATKPLNVNAIDTIELRPGERLENKKIGEVDTTKYEIRIKDELEGRKDLFTSYDMVKDGKKYNLNIEAKRDVVGESTIVYYIDRSMEGHNIEVDEDDNYSDTLGVEKRLLVKVVNHCPIVSLTKTKLECEAGQQIDFDLGVITDQDNETDDYSKYEFFDIDKRDAYGVIDDYGFFFDDRKLKVMIKASESAAGKAYISFKVNDEFGVYSDGEPMTKTFEVTVTNTRPKLSDNGNVIRLSGSGIQTHTVGTIYDPDNVDTRFTVNTLSMKYEGNKVWEDIRLYAEGNSLKARITPSKSTTGRATVYVKLEDQRKNYTKGMEDESYFDIVYHNSAPEVSLTSPSFNLEKGASYHARVVGTIVDPDGDTTFTIARTDSNKPKNVVEGSIYVKDNQIMIDVTAKDGRSGTEVFKFTVKDNYGNESDEQTITFHVS